MERLELPEKWYIKWDCEETFKLVQEYFDNTEFKCYYGYVPDAYSSFNNNYHSPSSIFPEDYLEISLDQLMSHAFYGNFPPISSGDYNYLIEFFNKLKQLVAPPKGYKAKKKLWKD